LSRFVPKIAPREFTTVRTFAAPRDLVFEAWIDPVRISAWFGPRGFGPDPPGCFREGPRFGLRVGSGVGARKVRRCARRFHCGVVPGAVVGAVVRSKVLVMVVRRSLRTGW